MQRITSYERQVIEVALRKGKSLRTIARGLGRDHRVIAREVKRNTGDYLPYTAASAHRIALRSERNRHRVKLEHDLDLKHYETIYQYIYAGEGRWEYLYPHLRRGRPQRRKQRARKPRKTLIPERISIHERPVEVQKKTRYGHWESDTIVCKKQQEVLSTQYERKAQLLRLHKVNDKSAPETERAIRDTVESLPQDLFRSMTFDNGSEGACHVRLRGDYNIETYFCDAYASWQKGGVENMNGLIRQYIPKSANLSRLTGDELYAIQERINNRPRKNLNYLTPNEVIASLVGH